MGGRFGKQAEKRASSSQKDNVEKIAFSAQFDGLPRGDDGGHSQSSGDESCCQRSEESSVDSASHGQDSVASSESADSGSTDDRERGTDLAIRFGDFEAILNLGPDNDSQEIELVVGAIVGDGEQQHEPPYLLEQCGYLRYSFRDKVLKRSKTYMRTYMRDSPKMRWFGTRTPFYHHVKEHQSPTPEHCHGIVETVQDVQPSQDHSSPITTNDVSDVNATQETTGPQPASGKSVDGTRAPNSRGEESTENAASSQVPEVENADRRNMKSTQRNNCKENMPKIDTTASRKPSTDRQADVKPARQEFPERKGTEGHHTDISVEGTPEINRTTMLDKQIVEPRKTRVVRSAQPEKDDYVALIEREDNWKENISRIETSALRKPGVSPTVNVNVVEQTLQVDESEVMTKFTEADKVTQSGSPTDIAKEMEEGKVQRKVTGRTNTGGHQSNSSVRAKPGMNQTRLNKQTEEPGRTRTSVVKGAIVGEKEQPELNDVKRRTLPVQKPQTNGQKEQTEIAGAQTVDQKIENTTGRGDMSKNRKDQANNPDNNRERQQHQTTGTSNQTRTVKCDKPAPKQDYRPKTKTQKKPPRAVEPKHEKWTHQPRNVRTRSQKEQQRAMNQQRKKVEQPGVTSKVEGAMKQQEFTSKIEENKEQPRTSRQTKQTNRSKVDKPSTKQSPEPEGKHPKEVSDQEMRKRTNEEPSGGERKTSAMGDARPSKEAPPRKTGMKTETAGKPEPTVPMITCRTNTPESVAKKEQGVEGTLSTEPTDSVDRKSSEVSSLIDTPKLDGVNKPESTKTRLKQTENDEEDNGNVVRTIIMESTAATGISRDQELMADAAQKTNARAACTKPRVMKKGNACTDPGTESLEQGPTVSASAGITPSRAGVRNPAVGGDTSSQGMQDVVPEDVTSLEGEQSFQEESVHQSQIEAKPGNILSEDKQTPLVGKSVTLNGTVSPTEYSCTHGATSTPWQPRSIIVNGDLDINSILDNISLTDDVASYSLEEICREGLRVKVNPVYDVNHGNAMLPLAFGPDNLPMNACDEFIVLAEDHGRTVYRGELTHKPHSREMIDTDAIDSDAVITNDNQQEKGDSLDAAENSKRGRRRRRVLDNILAENQEKQDECDAKKAVVKPKEVSPTRNGTPSHAKMNRKRDIKHGTTIVTEDKNERPKHEKVTQHVEIVDGKTLVQADENEKPSPNGKKTCFPKPTKTKFGRKADKQVARESKRTRSHVVFIAGRTRRILRKRPINPMGKAQSNLMDIKFCQGCGDTRQPNGQGLFPCPKCRSAYYCTRECQHGTAKIHKKECPGHKKARLLCKHT